MAAFSTAAGLIGLILPSGFPGGWIFGILYGVGNAYLVSRVLFRSESPVWRLVLGMAVLMALWSAVGGFAYQAYRINWAVLAVLIGGLPALLWWLGRRFPSGNRFPLMVGSEPPPVGPNPLSVSMGIVLAVSALTLTGIGFFILSQNAVAVPIRTPWDAVPADFFAVFFLAALAVSALSLSGVLGGFSAVPAVGLAALLSSVAVITYKIGFGFDPFIHQATERIIYATGNIDPKPFYYSGQYALVVILAKLTGIGLESVDRWLVPIGLAGLLPFAAWCLRRAFGWKWAIAATATVGVLLLPLSPFIASTPQGLANLLALLTVFSALPVSADRDALGPLGRFLPLLFASAAAVTHPLTGLPILVFAIAWRALLHKNGTERPRIAHWILAIAIAALGSAVLPTAFLANSAVSGTGADWNNRMLESASTIVAGLQSAMSETDRRFLPTLDVAYFWRDIRTPGLWFLGLAGLLFLYRKRPRLAMSYAVGLVALTGNWLAIKTSIRFGFLIDYERSSYADRLSDLALYFLVPAALYALAMILIRIRRGFPVMRLTAAVLLAALLTSSLYLAYPRRDRYETSRGWSTSQFDIDTVREIEADAEGQPYVVLANQAVSAAAIREVGFGRYYPLRDPERPGQETYFYPVPTGDPLYGLFLKMNDRLGDRAVANEAMEMAGVDLAYFVVNDYWWQAQRIVSNAKREADRNWDVDKGNFVFRYRRQEP
ncbi:hypothetical protein JW899_03540 [Candidatus Uhrbacteria bacterium]|nr:hypothetical protein [Candidatus Uhrbacteria bacterium]